MDEMQNVIKQIADTAAMRALELAHAPTRYLKSKQAAQYLDMANLTLEKWRALGQGPAFTRVGKFIRYDRQDLDEFMTRHRNQMDDSISAFPRLRSKGLGDQ